MSAVTLFESEFITQSTPFILRIWHAVLDAQPLDELSPKSSEFYDEILEHFDIQPFCELMLYDSLVLSQPFSSCFFFVVVDTFWRRVEIILLI